MGVLSFQCKRQFLNYKLSGTLNVLSFWNFLTNFRVVAFHDIDLYPSSKFEEKNQYFSQLKVNDKLSHHPLNVKQYFRQILHWRIFSSTLYFVRTHKNTKICKNRRILLFLSSFISSIRLYKRRWNFFQIWHPQ